MRAYRWHVTYRRGTETLTARANGIDRTDARRNASTNLGVPQEAIRSLVRLPQAVTPLAGNPLDNSTTN